MDDKQLDWHKKRAMVERGRVCVEMTRSLTNQIALAENNESVGRPEITIDEFTDSIPNIIGSCMARGIELFGVQLYGFVWMSNHGHLLLRAPRNNFAEFMAYLNGQIAVHANRFLDRRHQLWERRYAAAQVLDEGAELERLGYILANPQNAGVAESIHEWQGLSSAVFLFQNQEQRFLHFNRTAWHRKGCPQNIAPFLRTVKLKHECLPQLSSLDAKERQQKLRELIKAQSRPSPQEAIPVALESIKSVRRRLQARTLIPTERPESAKREGRNRSPQPLCHTTRPSLQVIYAQWFREFRFAYRDCSTAYRNGNIAVEFPPGSFAPSKYPSARYPDDPNRITTLHPTRMNLEIADALTEIAA